MTSVHFDVHRVIDFLQMERFVPIVSIARPLIDSAILQIDHLATASFSVARQ